MALVLDPIYIVNLTLCIIILILGIFGYRKKGNPVPLHVGIAFGARAKPNITCTYNTSPSDSVK